MLHPSYNYFTTERICAPLCQQVLYTVVAQAVQSPDISSLSFKALDMDAIDETKISLAAQLVFKLYQELGGNNKVAKGSELLERIRTEIVE